MRGIQRISDCRVGFALVIILPLLNMGCGSGGASPPDLPASAGGRSVNLLDDLDDGNHFNNWGGYWFTYDDKSNGGDSQVQPASGSVFRPSPGGAKNSKFCARMTGKVTTTYEQGFIGMGTDLARPNNPVNIRKYSGFEFWARGDGKKYRMRFRSPVTGDFDDFGVDFVAGKQWQRHTVSFDDLRQQGWGKKADRSDALGKVISVVWQNLGRPHLTIELAVDELRFLKAKD